MADNTPHDDELIAFERQVAHLRGQNPTIAVELVLDRCTTLYEQHDADQQQIAELRYFVEAVAAWPGDEREECPFCHERPDWHPVRHTDWCIVTKARAWLAAHP